MLQQQINYWTLRESMRHNRVSESIGWKEAESNRMNAVSNRMNANTNIYNAKINAINAVSNRMQANAALSQAAAAHRQAAVSERDVAVKERQSDSVIWSNYMKPLSGVIGNASGAVLGRGSKGAIVPGASKPRNAARNVANARRAVTIAAAASRYAKGGPIIAGAILGADTLKSVYDYVTDPNTDVSGLKAMNNARR